MHLVTPARLKHYSLVTRQLVGIRLLETDSETSSLFVHSNVKHMAY